MLLVAWFPHGAALLSHQDCVLSQLGIHRDVTLDVARMLNNNKERAVGGWCTVGFIAPVGY